MHTLLDGFSLSQRLDAARKDARQNEGLHVPWVWYIYEEKRQLDPAYERQTCYEQGDDHRAARSWVNLSEQQAQVQQFSEDCDSSPVETFSAACHKCGRRVGTTPRLCNVQSWKKSNSSIKYNLSLHEVELLLIGAVKCGVTGRSNHHQTTPSLGHCNPLPTKCKIRINTSTQNDTSPTRQAGRYPEWSLRWPHAWPVHAWWCMFPRAGSAVCSTRLTPSID